MNRKTNFLSGMVAGLVISTIAFVSISATLKSNESTETTPVTESLQKTNDALSGDMISVNDANALIANFQTNFIEKNNLPSNTTIGGIIGKSELQNLVSSPGEERYIKFRFYLQGGGPSSDGKIGVIFYPEENAEQVLRTGSGSFCPTICNVPD